MELWLWPSPPPFDGNIILKISFWCASTSPSVKQISCKVSVLERLRSLAPGLLHILAPRGLSHQLEGSLATLDSWNCSTTYWFCWRNSSQQSQAMLFISCCHHNYFLRAGELYSFLSLLAGAQRIKDKDYNGYVQAEELLIGIYPFKYV